MLILFTLVIVAAVTYAHFSEGFFTAGLMFCNVLIAGLQKMLTPLLGHPSADRPHSAAFDAAEKREHTAAAGAGDNSEVRL